MTVTSPREHQPVRLTTTTGSPTRPTATPDGDTVVFACGTDQPLNRNVFTVGIDGRDQTQLTDRELNLSWMPAVSPDGTKIAYVVEKEGNSDIHVMNIDGTGNRNVTNTNRGYWYPTWAPDSKSLLVTSRDTRHGNLELVQISVNSNSTKQLTDLGYNTDTPTLSPDGEHAVFGLDPGFGMPVLCSIKTDGTGFKTYANDLILAGTPSVSPQNEVVFAGIDSSYRMSIYTIELDSDKPAQRLTDSDFALSPTFSPDGSRIAWMASDENSDMQIYEANSDGTGAHKVTSGDAFHSSPSYTPDGEALLYLSTSSGKSEIYRQQLD